MAVIPNKNADSLLKFKIEFTKISTKELLVLMVELCSEEELNDLLANGIESAKSRFATKLAIKISNE